MFSSACQGSELILVDSRFGRGRLRCFRCLSSQSFPCISGCSSGPLVGAAELPSSTRTHTVAAPSQASSAAFRTGLSQLQPLGEGEAHLFSWGVVFTVQVTVLTLLGQTEKIHDVPGVRLQGAGIKAETRNFFWGVD